MYHENVKGNKINDPVTELTNLAHKNPNHRYLQSWVLDQVTIHLKQLDRAEEAEKIGQLKKLLS